MEQCRGTTMLLTRALIHCSYASVSKKRCTAMIILLKMHGTMCGHCNVTHEDSHPLPPSPSTASTWGGARSLSHASRPADPALQASPAQAELRRMLHKMRGLESVFVLRGPPTPYIETVLCVWQKIDSDAWSQLVGADPPSPCGYGSKS